MSDENLFQENQVPESSEYTEEAPTKEKKTSKPGPYTLARIRSSQLVNNKYKFSRITLDGNEVYFIQAMSLNFDRILRRTPREVNRYADDYIVPLGITPLETIISTYGLSYGFIYSDDTWLTLINRFNQNQTFEDAKSIIQYLHAAATIKCIAMSGQTLDTRNQFSFASAIQKVDTYTIVHNFTQMVK